MRQFFVYLAIITLTVFTVQAEGSIGGSGGSISCSSDEAGLANGSTSVTVGTTTIYTGYHQISGNNQNPIIARYDDGQLVWCRDDYEQTGDDGRGYGLYWDGTTLYGVFTATGTQSGPNYTRWTNGGWLNSYGQGGGPRVSIILKIDPATGDPQSGTYLYAKLTNGKTNSLSVTDLSLTANNTLLVTANAWFSPLNTDKSRMNCSGDSPFTYRVELSTNLNNALGAEADGCVSSSPAPGAAPPLMQSFPADQMMISSAEDWGHFRWEASSDFSWYGLYISKPNGGSYYQWHRADEVCDSNTCSLDLHLQLTAVGQYSWYVAGWGESAGMGRWGSGSSFTLNLSRPALPGGVQTDVTGGIPTVTWNNDSGAGYFQLYIGQPPYTAPAAFVGWLYSGDVCNNGTCSYTLGNAVPAGNYEVWMQAWGPAGFSLNDAGAPGWSGPHNFSFGTS